MAGVVEPPARLLLKIGVTPDAVTIVGAVGACASSLLLLSQGNFLWGFVLCFIFGLSDLFDGTMARLRGVSGPWGNFLDATLDRITDGVVFGSLAWWGYTTNDPWIVSGSLLALVSGQVVSYARARAEAVGATASVGIAERAERLLLTGLGVLLAGFGVPYALPIILWIVGVAGVVTVGQRIFVVHRQLRGESDS